MIQNLFAVLPQWNIFQFHELTRVKNLQWKNQKQFLHDNTKIFLSYVD